MTWELVAVDTSGGKALLRHEESWFLASRARDWQPLEVDGHRAQFLAASMTRVRRSFRGFEDAVREVRRLCAGGPLRPPHAWEEGFPDVIRRFGGCLDRFFEARGCSTDASFHLSLEVFRRLFDGGPVEEGEISWRLYRLATEIRPTPRVDSGRVPPAPGPYLALEGARLVKALQGLPPRTLRCLYFYSVLKSGRRGTMRLARLSEDELRTNLVEVGVRIGRAIDQLGDPAVVEACIKAVKGRRL